ncbi:MAG: hypothetical protein LWX07_04995 [Bacteroidetes bacterium]|nr:hypothetical protein [Bacteroidota bacterium]
MLNKKTAVLLLILFFAFLNANAQISKSENGFKLSEIREKVMSADTKDDFNKNVVSENKKSPGISLLLSVLLPGAGHYYAGRSDIGAYYFGTEVAMWLGFFGVNYYGGVLRDDARSYAATHSGLVKSGKDDDYFSNVGSYLNIYEYNNFMLATGQYNKIYDVNSYFWNWDSKDNMDTYDSQRKKSERTYNLRTVFVTGMILNRLVSGISALVLTNKGNNGSGGMKVNSEFMMSQENRIDGLKINFVKSF